MKKRQTSHLRDTGIFTGELVTEPGQPLSIADRNSSVGVRVDESLFLEEDHCLIDALSGCANQISDIALR